VITDQQVIQKVKIKERISDLSKVSKSTKSLAQKVYISVSLSIKVYDQMIEIRCTPPSIFQRVSDCDSYSDISTSRQIPPLRFDQKATQTLSWSYAIALVQNLSQSSPLGSPQLLPGPSPDLPEPTLQVFQQEREGEEEGDHQSHTLGSSFLALNHPILFHEVACPNRSPGALGKAQSGLTTLCRLPSHQNLSLGFLASFQSSFTASHTKSNLNLALDRLL
jgi:hypothetical protein